MGNWTIARALKAWRQVVNSAIRVAHFGLFHAEREPHRQRGISQA
jgi:hypothetical protein